MVEMTIVFVSPPLMRKSSNTPLDTVLALSTQQWTLVFMYLSTPYPYYLFLNSVARLCYLFLNPVTRFTLYLLYFLKKFGRLF